MSNDADPMRPTATDAPTPGASAPMADAIAALAAALRQDRDAEVQEARRQRRRAFRWRLVSILLVIGVVASIVLGRESAPSAHVARVAVSGMIVDDPKRDALFQSLGASDAVAAVVIRIDSPGGTTVGGEALFASIRALADQKPVVAVLGEVAASAAYIAALASDHIVSRGNTLTGSVGVILTAPNVSRTLETLGVEIVELKSGPRKAEPSLFAPVDRDALDVERAMIEDSFEWFLGLVRERRAPSAETLALISDGRTLNGRQALALGLVDRLGGEAEARAWLEAERGVAANLPIRERKVEERRPGLFARLLDPFGAGAGSGLGALGGLFDDERPALLERLDTLLGGPVLSSSVGS